MIDLLLRRLGVLTMVPLLRTIWLAFTKDSMVFGSTSIALATAILSAHQAGRSDSFPVMLGL